MGPILPLNVCNGVYMTSYILMIPFRSIRGTSSQKAIMIVDELTSARTLTGGLDVAVQMIDK